jgi:hypothetical protein
MRFSSTLFDVRLFPPSLSELPFSLSGLAALTLSPFRERFIVRPE